MDILSVLAAVVAVALFPGGAYTLALAGGMAASGRLRAARVPWRSGSLAAAALLLFAAALVPMPGAPSAVLPLDSGAAANLLAALLLAGGALAVGTAPHWPRLRLVTAVAAVAPLLVLAAGAATLDFPVVVALPGRDLAAARALAAVTVLLAAPVLGRPADTTHPRGLRALSLAVPALVAAVLLAPPGWSGLPSTATAAMVFGGALAYAAAAAPLAWLLRHHDLPLVALATATSIASISLTAVASH